MNWRKDMVGGVFGINSSINKLFSWQQPASADPDSPMLEYAGSAGGGNSYYDYRLFTQFSYSQQQTSSFGLNWRYSPQAMHDSKVQTPTLTVEDTEEYHLFNVNGSWQFNERMRLRGGIDNIVDEQPPIVGANPTNVTTRPTAWVTRALATTTRSAAATTFGVAVSF